MDRSRLQVGLIINLNIPVSTVSTESDDQIVIASVHIRTDQEESDPESGHLVTRCFVCHRLREGGGGTGIYLSKYYKKSSFASFFGSKLRGSSFWRPASQLHLHRRHRASCSSRRIIPHVEACTAASSLSAGPVALQLVSTVKPAVPKVAPRAKL